jgi:hypothetical protein
MSLLDLSSLVDREAKRLSSRGESVGDDSIWNMKFLLIDTVCTLALFRHLVDVPKKSRGKGTTAQSDSIAKWRGRKRDVLPAPLREMAVANGAR